MAAVTINSGPVDATDFLREVPQDKWLVLMQARRSYLSIHLASDCRRLLEFVEDGEQMYAPLGFESLEDFIRRGLELDPHDVAWAVEGLRRIKPDEPIPYEKAKALGKHGRPKWIDQAGSGKDGDAKYSGTTSAYILARLDRDGHHELAEKVRSKAMSARAAARAAGIVRDVDLVEKTWKLWQKMTPEQRAQFRARIDEAGGRNNIW